MEKAREILEKISGAIEIVLAVIVAIAAVIELITAIPDMAITLFSGADDTALTTILQQVFGIAVAVEFLKMLLKPDFKIVVEVIIFLIARHMIVATSSPMEDFISVLSICLLLLVQQGIRLLYKREKREEQQLEKQQEEEKK